MNDLQKQISWGGECAKSFQEYYFFLYTKLLLHILNAMGKKKSIFNSFFLTFFFLNVNK